MSAGTIWDVGAGDGTDPFADLGCRTTATLEAVEALGHPCGWERGGGVEVATDQRQLDLIRKEHAHMAAKGYRLEMLEGRAAVLRHHFNPEFPFFCSRISQLCHTTPLDHRRVTSLHDTLIRAHALRVPIGAWIPMRCCRTH